MMAQATVRVHYCDDVRQEIGGKYSLMGCYNAVMLLESADGGPCVLPKVCAAIEIFAPIAKQFNSMTIRARLNDEVLGELVLPPEQIAAIKDKGSSPYITEPLWHGFNAFMNFTPLVVPPSGGKLRVEAVIDEETVRGNGLLLVVNGKAPAAAPDGTEKK